ncbi:hypothetical protein KKA49_02185 [Patescibacteria group bacterium]|nr:hypothetical protein [Patescibacteria group bacterium]MBU1457568.1 hypothetical protein [Patescibacteria group bacterium]
MLKNIRKNLWFISAFVSKYKYLIIVGIILSIVLGLIITKIQKILPGLSNTDIHIGLVGRTQPATYPNKSQGS